MSDRTREPQWIDADGYQLALDGGEIRCRNACGRPLKTIPAKVRKTEAFNILSATRELLARHDERCQSTVLGWFLNGEEVPLALIEAVWEDEAWRHWLTDLVIRSGTVTGLLRDVDDRGLHVLSPDSGSVTVAVTGTGTLTFPHPAEIPGIAAWRELAIDSGIHQNIEQLFREVHPRPEDEETLRASLGAYADAMYEETSDLLERARDAGFVASLDGVRVTVGESGVLTTAVLEIRTDGLDDGADLDYLYFERDGRTISPEDVGPVAYSEAIRMGRYIYAGGTLETEIDGW
ncbi:DUF4132 domain-containing protein [Corynebacterium sp. CCM 9185]|uniref:DUF4132 domain-containing protein n=1 Tax=Corynebacterium marambiense TaxID=2765364 RepID=A0ABS0VWF3_9CORY|nr:DUF4132 domain-containing protein [Corynebacterium marambiense]MBI9001106.1 DUF4132 domain-containing protein [Corynebacterium marambiense]MCK7664347.1 DUF4132 domain-containing protein [Corynebacterium marambiense]